jgi:flagellar biosynthesis/type III secretory pathway M-ring protein FliF/YscJ
MAAEAVITQVPVINDTVLLGILVVLGMVVIYLIIREIRIMKTSNRAIELDLEKDKLKLLQQHEASKAFPFTRFTPEQTGAIKQVEDENTNLETNINAKEKLLEKRLTRLENLVKERKLDNLLGNVQEQEKKVK